MNAPGHEARKCRGAARQVAVTLPEAADLDSAFPLEGGHFRRSQADQFHGAETLLQRGHHRGDVARRALARGKVSNAM